MIASVTSILDRPAGVCRRADAGRRHRQALRRAARACRRFVCGECRRGARPHRTQRRGQDHLAGSDRGPCAHGRRSRPVARQLPSPVATSRAHVLPAGRLRPWHDEYVARLLEFFAAAYGRPARITTEAIGALGLAPVLRRRVGALSKGYGRRLMLALALIAPQPLLLMDEPFDGFDLRQTREVMGVVREVARSGRTLVLAIHQLIDAERVCDRFVLLADGRIRGIGTLAELRAQTGMSAGGLEDVFLALT